VILEEHQEKYDGIEEELNKNTLISMTTREDSERLQNLITKEEENFKFLLN
jgi:hypothetical protein